MFSTSSRHGQEHDCFVSQMAIAQITDARQRKNLNHQDNAADQSTCEQVDEQCDSIRPRCCMRCRMMTSCFFDTTNGKSMRPIYDEKIRSSSTQLTFENGKMSLHEKSESNNDIMRANIPGVYGYWKAYKRSATKRNTRLLPVYLFQKSIVYE